MLLLGIQESHSENYCSTWYLKRVFSSYRHQFSISSHQVIAKKSSRPAISVMSRTAPSLPQRCTHAHTHTQSHVMEKTTTSADCCLFPPCPLAFMIAACYITALKSQALTLMGHPPSSSNHLLTSVYAPLKNSQWVTHAIEGVASESGTVSPSHDGEGLSASVLSVHPGRGRCWVTTWRSDQETSWKRIQGEQRTKGQGVGAGERRVGYTFKGMEHRAWAGWWKDRGSKSAGGVGGEPCPGGSPFLMAQLHHRHQHVSTERPHCWHASASELGEPVGNSEDWIIKGQHGHSGIKKIWHIYTMEYCSAIKKRMKWCHLQPAWMQLEIIIPNEVKKRRTNTICYHVYVESKLWNTVSDVENRPVAAKGWGWWGVDWELGISRRKVAHPGWRNKVPLCSTYRCTYIPIEPIFLYTCIPIEYRNHIQHSVINQEGKYDKEGTYISILVVMYGCESGTIKKAEHRRIDAFERWCWIRLFESSFDSKEIKPVYPKGDQPWIFMRTDAEAEAQILWFPDTNS